MPQKSNLRWPWLRTIAALTVPLTLGLWLPGHISVTLTPSLGYRVFFLRQPESKGFKVGDYLLFRKRLPEATTDQLLKRVGCAPGQRLTVTSGEYACDQVPLGRALLRDSKGKPLPQLVFNGPVPEGKLFMIGPHPRSYDSRYFGFIEANTVLKQAYPIW